MEKGKTNNPGGRPRGVPNKSTAVMRTWLERLINKNKKTLEADLMKLKPFERWKVVEGLMQYTLPKMSNVDAKIDLGRLSDFDLDNVVNELLEKIEKNEN